MPSSVLSCIKKYVIEPMYFVYANAKNDHGERCRQVYYLCNVEKKEKEKKRT